MLPNFDDENIKQDKSRGLPDLEDFFDDTVSFDNDGGFSFTDDNQEPDMDNGVLFQDNIGDSVDDEFVFVDENIEEVYSFDESLLEYGLDESEIKSNENKEDLVVDNSNSNTSVIPKYKSNKNNNLIGVIKGLLSLFSFRLVPKPTNNNDNENVVQKTPAKQNRSKKHIKITRLLMSVFKGVIFIFVLFGIFLFFTKPVQENISLPDDAGLQILDYSIGDNSIIANVKLDGPTQEITITPEVYKASVLGLGWEPMGYCKTITKDLQDQKEASLKFECQDMQGGLQVATFMVEE